MKILLIEDSPDDVFLTTRALNKLDQSDIDVVHDGIHALDYLFGKECNVSGHTLINKPDIILLDQRMTMVDGLEFMEKVHKALRDNKIPVIVITSSTLESEKQRFFELGVQEYIGKPVNTEGLRRAISAAMTTTCSPFH